MPDSIYAVQAESTDTFGRTMLHARHNHLVVDGPAKNDAPGEAPTPAELFLAGVATCAVELISFIAREEKIALGGVRASIEGTVPADRIREDVSIFSRVRLGFELRGVGDEDAGRLVEAFKGR